MITNIKQTVASDLSADNDVMNFRQRHFLQDHICAGISWSATGDSPSKSLSAACTYGLEKIKENLQNYNVWLLVGTSAWQPNTRIVRYHRLWGALKARGLELLDTDESEEFVLEQDGKLKFFGAIKISESQIKRIVQVLLEEHCTYLIALPKNSLLDRIMISGWQGNLEDDLHIIDFVVESDGLLLKQIGEFDASERGIVAVGHSRIVTKLIGSERGRDN